jgi:hypothetical protein
LNNQPLSSSLPTAAWLQDTKDGFQGEHA